MMVLVKIVSYHTICECTRLTSSECGNARLCSAASNGWGLECTMHLAVTPGGTLGTLGTLLQEELQLRCLRISQA